MYHHHVAGVDNAFAATACRLLVKRLDLDAMVLEPDLWPAPSREERRSVVHRDGPIDGDAASGLAPCDHEVPHGHLVVHGEAHDQGAAAKPRALDQQAAAALRRRHN